jgi:ubiquitin-like protein ATG12
MSQSPAERAIEEDDQTEAPLTMAASVVLTHLPRDASKALETAGNLSIEKSTYCKQHLTMSQHCRSHRASSANRLSTSSEPEGFQAINKSALRDNRSFFKKTTGRQRT